MKGINFHYETDFKLDDESKYSYWVNEIVTVHNRLIKDVNFVFCDDEYLIEINRSYLNHDTYTDIITFNNAVDDRVFTDIFISIERVLFNSKKFNVDFKIELLRVMAHGILHLLDFNDKEEVDIAQMRIEEEKMIKLFHVEH